MHTVPDRQLTQWQNGAAALRQLLDTPKEGIPNLDLPTIASYIMGLIEWLDLWISSETALPQGGDGLPEFVAPSTSYLTTGISSLAHLLESERDRLYRLLWGLGQTPVQLDRAYLLHLHDWITHAIQAETILPAKAPASGNKPKESRLKNALTAILMRAAITTCCGYIPFIVGIAWAIKVNLGIGLALIALGLAIGIPSTMHLARAAFQTESPRSSN